MARALVVFLALAVAGCGGHPLASSSGCQQSTQCTGGRICVANTCVAPQQCSAYASCPVGEYCTSGGVCAGGNSPYLTFQSQPPAIVYEGSAIASIQVAAFDANHTPLGSGTVSLSGGALKSSPATAQVGSSGIATFSNLAVTTPVHNATLTASMTGALSATSANFDVTSWKVTTVSGGAMKTVALDPGHAGVAYTDGYRSTDGAVSWSPLATQPLNLFNAPNTPRNYFFHAGTIFSGVVGGYSTSTDGGATWSPVISPDGQVSSSACTSLTWVGSTLYALCSNGLYATVNNGTSFTLLTGGAGQPASLGIVTASSTALYGQAPGPSASPIWIYSGGSWRQVASSQAFFALTASSGATQAQDVVYGLGSAGLVNVQGASQPANTGWIAPTGIPTFAALVPDAASATTYYAVDTSGPILKTTNTGGAWTKIYDRPCSGGTPHGAASGQTVLIGCSADVILRSSDGGTTFTFAMPGIHDLTGGSEVVYHPKQGGLAYALVSRQGVFSSSDSGVTWTAQSLTPSLLELRPDPKAPANLFGLATNGDLMQSADSGKTFTVALSGSTNSPGQVNDVAYVPPAACGAATSATYVVAGSGGIFTGSGAPGTTPATLPALSNGAYPLYLAVDPSTPATLFSVANDSSVLKSTDCGSTWTFLSMSNFFGPIAVDPTNSLNLLAAASDIFRSTNGGAAFSTAYHSGYSQSDRVAFAPGTASAIAVGHYDAAVRTDDGGATWSDISPGLGQFGFAARSVSFDTAAPARVLISTDTGVFLSTTGGK